MYGARTSHMPFPQPVISDMAWWRDTLSQWSQTPLASSVGVRRSVLIQTDASGYAAGAALIDSESLDLIQWFHFPWPPAMALDRSGSNPKGWSINSLELAAAMLAIEVWGARSAHSNVLLQSDNTAAVSNLNRHCPSCWWSTCIIRSVVLLCINFDLTLRSTHISGDWNVRADAASRVFNDVFNQNLLPVSKRIYLPPLPLSLAPLLSMLD